MRGFKRFDRGQAIMPCGTGKTLIAMWVSQRLSARLTLVVVPSLDLLAQTRREWKTHGTTISDLVVCSDNTIASADDSSVQTPAQLGVPVTEDPAQIAAFMRRPGRRVVFSTYHSTPKIAEAQALGAPRFDLVIADEAHRTVGDASMPFATLLDDRRIRSRRRLFMTATPRTTRKVRSAAPDIDVAGMDDPALYGPVFHRLSLRRAITEGLLSDYQVAVVVVDSQIPREFAENGRLLELRTPPSRTRSDGRALAALLAVLRSMENYDLTRLISFHNRVDHARRFAAALPSVARWMPADHRPRGSVFADHVSGQMHEGDRASRLEQFAQLPAGASGLIANVRCLVEGVDVPTIDGVVFVDPRRSVVDCVQAVGRALRYVPGKPRSTIVLPVCVESGADPDSTLSSSPWQNVWQVLRALRDHDEALAEELDGLRRQLGALRAPVGRPVRILLDDPRRVNPDFARAFDVALLEETTAAWDFWYGMLLSYISQHGDARVPPDYLWDGHRLGQWLNNQKAALRRGTLAVERRRQLEVLPGWTLTPVEDDWRRTYDEVVAFARKSGHVGIPATESQRLHTWIGQQRKLFRRGKMPRASQRLLEALPGWTWDPRQDQWNRAMNSLRGYVKDNGTARVVAGFRDATGFDLGAFVAKQQDLHAGGELAAARIAELEALPRWTWHPATKRRADAWDEHAKAFQRFVAEQGSAVVPAGCVDSAGLDLGRWVARQRARQQKLTRTQRLRLDRLGMIWNVHEYNWLRMYELLVQFKRREGHAHVPTRHLEAGHHLGKWLSQQRMKRTSLSPEHRKLLEKLDVAWNKHDATWHATFELARIWAREHGTWRMPYNHTVSGMRLGAWVSSQAAKYRTGVLPDHRKRLLETLPGWTTT
jgi:superfamily II DNA or RNA helicase